MSPMKLSCTLTSERDGRWRAVHESRDLGRVEALADSREVVLEKLKTVFDPEIPVNVVDLGLIYDVKVNKLVDDKCRVDVKMTLTAQGCGMGPSIAADAQMKRAT